jgi:tetratricopeptide (TPR) repeat protein
MSTNTDLDALWREFSSKCYQAAGLVESGSPSDMQQAIGIFRDLMGRPLPDLDKVIVLLNIGVIFEKLQDFDKALQAYDQAISIESRHQRFSATERKAMCLATAKRNTESVDVYTQLLSRSDLMLQERRRMEENIRKLR